ncbi:hypothetical protein [Cryptosporangium aurantiacum]|uniref:Uncharacterized protein n=1 Tax=Cryptosporangium aurantiacum TaxID=134849 RepID=A0A1M7HHV4_9ACTN|nr:hypothetical protein [Cryptosporangium aurantiacum]SHM27727.1 hypothetical protein SAMN05443668_101185 [Cryptosporangium aurantiacum]
MDLGEVLVLGGRTIRLTSVELSRTYGGLIEGYPNSRLNDAHLQRARGRLETRYPRTPTYVLEPARTLHPERNFSRGRPWEELPAVECRGFFTSTTIGPPGEYGLGMSCLAVAWWQDHDGAIFSDSARPAFATLDWKAHAEDRTDPD